MDAKEGEKAADAAAASPSSPTTSSSQEARKLSCTKHFDALWFCYSPFHQVQQYYRHGEFDNCFGKWNALFDCLNLKTKKSSEVQEILEAREKAKQHIWTIRTVEEASVNWWMMIKSLLPRLYWEPQSFKTKV
uniref:Uncharacterized protein n=1 Tax=Musa acuminata subsp. malaccensis TaxID=214687 RepID=A0A804I5J5_MUSAM|nr:PREDICTED: uncharacterized protein C227.17c [Musa acuminata subsp. malaccensis]